MAKNTNKSRPPLPSPFSGTCPDFFRFKGASWCSDFKWACPEKFASAKHRSSQVVALDYEVFPGARADFYKLRHFPVRSRWGSAFSGDISRVWLAPMIIACFRDDCAHVSIESCLFWSHLWTLWLRSGLRTCASFKISNGGRSGLT